MSTYADGGWPLAASLILLLGLLGFAAYRKRRSLPKLRLAAQDAATDEENQPEPARAPAARPVRQNNGDAEPRWKVSLPRWLRGVLGFLVAAVVIVIVANWLVHAFLSWSPAGTSATQVASHSTAGSTVDGQQARALADRQRIESEEHVVTIRFGQVPSWIQNPGGSYRMMYATDGDKVLGMQCSPTTDAPPTNALGPDQYPCSESVTTNWFRFFAMTEEEGPVTIRYHFRHV